jgi:hypothetical protein
LDYVNIEVDYFNGTGSSVGSATPTQTLLKVTETNRKNVVKVIYAAPSSPAFQFAFYPYTTDITNPAAPVAKSDFTIKLYSIGLGGASSLTANDWVLTLVPTVKHTGTATAAAAFDLTKTVEQLAKTVFKFSGNVAHYEFELNAGFYLIEHYFSKLTATTTPVPTWFTFQTDAYACPYNPDFGDYYGNFQGCTVSTITDGLPCASYDKITKVCSLCIDGYTLINGSCWANTTCPARQYFHFGQCLPVSSTCGDFDNFTGLCRNCADSANFENVNGSCVRKTVTCAPNQYQTNYTCFNASSTCATFDPNSGKCLTCIS